jgi:hypothetical protein
LFFKALSDIFRFTKSILLNFILSPCQYLQHIYLLTVAVSFTILMFTFVL